MANRFKEQPAELKPRERVMAAGNASGCSEAELLAIILKTGAAGCNVLELARRIVMAFGGAKELVKCDFTELQAKVEEYNGKEENKDRRILGLGPVKMVELAAAFELARRGLLSMKEREKIETADAAAKVFAAAVEKGEENERFMVLPLDARQRPMTPPIMVAKGTVNGVNVHPRDVYKEAVRRNATSIIVAHNHPSGETKPSRQDIALTEQLEEASKMMGIPLLDHIIVADGDEATGGKMRYYSFRENGRMA